MTTDTQTLHSPFWNSRMDLHQLLSRIFWKKTGPAKQATSKRQNIKC